MGTNSPDEYLLTRQQRLAQAVQEEGFLGFVLNAGPSQVYLTGLHFHLSERPAVAVIMPGNPVVFVIPELEADKTKELPYDSQVFLYGEDPTSWGDAFAQAFRFLGVSVGSFGIEPQRLRVLELRHLEAVAPGLKYLSGERLIAGLRAVKDPEEIDRMRAAVEVAQNALFIILPSIEVGITERELARRLTGELFQAGTDPQLPFSPIVAFGPNSANPHAIPTDRRLSRGDLVLIDWGANKGGYFSDITRTFAAGEPDSELAHIARIVVEANAAARDMAAPGVLAGDVDRAARDIIEAAGYGEKFIHRTGHGLGLEGHEAPYIRAANQVPLMPGMTFTIEPGIYLSGFGGVRIEDDILITADGSESLTNFPRSLRRLDA